MFKRKISKKTSSILEDRIYNITQSQIEEGFESQPSMPHNPVKAETGSILSSEQKKEILKDIFKLPANPAFKLKSQLLDNPQSILDEYLPSLFKFLEWTLLFCLGYFGFSYAWIISCSVLYLYRNMGRPEGSVSSDCVHEKEVLKSKIEHLPSWVTFPDVERVEWINIIIKKVWPNIGTISQQIAKRLVEPKIKEILNRLRLEELSNFKLKGVILGSIPVRVGGIKVYERNTGRDEIVMDIEIIYQGDARVNFSVQHMDCEVHQISFRGTVRLTIKPLMDVMPLVGGFEFYFMQMPEYDYSLGKLANFGEIPGISNIIKSVLDNIIRRGFVWPNRFSFYFPIESVRSLENQLFAMPTPQGVLEVMVSKGRNLVKKDKHLIGGKSDPYIILSIGEKNISFKNQYAEKTVDPTWNYKAEFPLEEIQGLDLKLEVYDYDAGSEDDFMGRTFLSVSSVLAGNIEDRWIRLDDTKHGDILVSMFWKPITHSIEDFSSYVVAVYIDSCSSLTAGKSAPLSKCEISISSPQSEKTLLRQDSKKWIPSNKFESYTTKPRGPSESPVFQEGYFFLSKNPSLDSISVQVIDHRGGLVLGSACVRISYILGLPDRQFTRMEWPLEGASSQAATIILSAKLYSC